METKSEDQIHKLRLKINETVNINENFTSLNEIFQKNINFDKLKKLLKVFDNYLDSSRNNLSPTTKPFYLNSEHNSMNFKNNIDDFESKNLLLYNQFKCFYYL
jgi:hypothetical protein